MTIFMLGRVILFLSIGSILAVLAEEKELNITHPHKNIATSNLPSAKFVHGCHLTNNQYPFNVLPGSGWDNLSNRELGQVLKVAYSRCKSSNDGTFLIPDKTKITAFMKSRVQMDSDIVTHFSKYSSLTSKSVNLEVSSATPNVQISGSFSYEKKDIKDNQMKEKSAFSQTQLRYELYRVSFEPDSELNDRFRERILDLGVLIENKKGSAHAHYLADLIVRDFGTHVIKSVDAGAILSKIDVLKGDYLSKHEGSQHSVTLAASVSMRESLGIKISGNYKTGHSEMEEYNKNCVSTRISTIGGGPFGSNFTLTKWEKTLSTNLVAIDRIGEPLNHIITKRNVPEFDDKIVYEIGNHIKEAISRYYSANTRTGCMDIMSKNFDENANADSGLCNNIENGNFFGGLYQKCSLDDDSLCENIIQKNAATGDYSCPNGFTPVKLYSFKYKCEGDNCPIYETFWCVSNGKSSKGYEIFFGGIYTTNIQNPFYRADSCPQYFFPANVGINGKVCISMDKELGFKNSLPFGGFYSCSMGNPLAQKKGFNSTVNGSYFPKACGSGYSSHFALLDGVCQLSYCVSTNALTKGYDLPLYRPPFIDIKTESEVVNINALKTSAGIKMILSENGSWETMIPEFYSTYKYAIITVLFLVLLSLLFLMAVLAWKGFRQFLGRIFTKIPLVNKKQSNHKPIRVQIKVTK